MRERTHLDLFTGLAGFALAARANGVRTIAMCEIDPKCRAFLAKAWPGIPVWDDVRTFNVGHATKDGRRFNEAIAGDSDAEKLRRSRTTSNGDSSSHVWLLTAGVPCQPVSLAGKRRGVEDDRYLWPQTFAVIARVRPTWVLCENPPGVSMVLPGICAELGRLGYRWQVIGIPACAVGSPQRRERWWIIGCLADAARNGQRGKPETQRAMWERVGASTQGDLADASQRGQREYGGAPWHAGYADKRGEECVADAKVGTEWPRLCAAEPGRKRGRRSGDGNGMADAECGRRREQYQSPWRGNPHQNEGAHFWSDAVLLPCADGKVRRAPSDTVGLVDGLHRSVLAALGNAIVPQVAARIIAAMIQAEEEP